MKYQALFALLGNIYGGDGRTTFALPDLRGRVPIGTTGGTSSGLTKAVLGQKGGTENATLPAHTHAAALSNATAAVQGTFSVSNTVATLEQPSVGCSIAGPITDNNGQAIITFGFNNATPNTAIAGLNVSGGAVTGNVAVANAGTGNGNYANMQPFLALNYVIVLDGIFPQQP